MDLSLLVVNWNTGPLLRACVQSCLDAADGLHLEVIVVDNQSTDTSMEDLPTDERCTYVRNSNNAGFAAANNQAYAVSSGRYVFMLNPDTVVKSGALRTMVDFMDAHPDAGGLGPRLLNADGTLQYSCSKLPNLHALVNESFALNRIFPGRERFDSTLMTYWPHNDCRTVPQPSGAALLLRRTTLETVGFLDERFYVYLEEVDLCKRIQEAGWRIYFLPSAEIVHHGGQSSINNPDVRIVARYRSLLLYYQKHFGLVTNIGARALVVIQMMMRIAALPIAGSAISWSASGKFTRRAAAARYLNVMKLSVTPLRVARDGEPSV